MYRFTKVLLLAVLGVVLLGAAGCQDEIDEICDFAKGALEATQRILDVADRGVVAAEAGVAASCASFGVDCSDALEILRLAKEFFVEARIRFVKAELLYAGVCKPDGSPVSIEALSNDDLSYIKREVKDLKKWIKLHGGTS